MPRIYVASLSDYNAGVLHGVWIDVEGLTEDDIMEQVEAMLAESPTDPGAEEWAIHDYEGYEGFPLSEWESFGDVVTLAAAVKKHGRAVKAWLDAFGHDEWDEEAFLDSYVGKFESARDFAFNLAHEVGAFTLNVARGPYDSPEPTDLSSEWPFNCIDWDAAARELQESYIIEVARDGVHVFWAN